MPPKTVWWICPIEPDSKWKAKWVKVVLSTGEEIESHWACDLSGEEQPPFRGWFNRKYCQVSQPQFWKQL